MSAVDKFLENSDVSGKRVAEVTVELLLFIFCVWLVAGGINDGVITVKIMMWVVFTWLLFDLALLFLKRDHEKRKAREEKEELNW